MSDECEIDAIDGVALIATERKRQIVKEGFTPGHDSLNQYGDLALAAACYALPENERPLDSNRGVPSYWPWAWDEMFWKPTPTDRIRELTKAGALIAAEIDRLQRAQKGGGK